MQIFAPYLNGGVNFFCLVPRSMSCSKVTWQSIRMEVLGTSMNFCLANTCKTHHGNHTKLFDVS